eukprot:1153419-Pelagomonas_calceolata.AAC.2
MPAPAKRPRALRLENLSLRASASISISSDDSPLHHYHDAVALPQDGKPLSIDHYAGNTLLLERIKRDKHRVDVQKLKPEEDLSGKGSHGLL